MRAGATPSPDLASRVVEGDELRHKVDGDQFDSTTIVFTKGAFVYQVLASGPGIDDRRGELIDAAQALYERVPVDRPRS